MLRTRKGFTLIELLIVVVIIGILAAIAIPKFSKTKERAYVASMKSDLRNLATNEETYASSNAGAYLDAGTVTNTTPLAAMPDYHTSPNVTVVLGGTSPAWTATATDSRSAALGCSIDASGLITATSGLTC
jgi:type IV pilus assembly protein PilA